MDNGEGRTYGKWFQPIGWADDPLHADRILGVRILSDTKGRPDFVEIRWQAADGQRFRTLRLDWLNALALLSFLKSAQLDAGFPFPDDPRDPSWRAGDGKR